MLQLPNHTRMGRKRGKSKCGVLSALSYRCFSTVTIHHCHVRLGQPRPIRSAEARRPSLGRGCPVATSLSEAGQPGVLLAGRRLANPLVQSHAKNDRPSNYHWCEDPTAVEEQIEVGVMDVFGEHEGNQPNDRIIAHCQRDDLVKPQRKSGRRDVPYQHEAEDAYSGLWDFSVAALHFP